jgi:PhoPQ-activated pathogenicity-related protein
LYITGGSNGAFPPTGTGEDELVCITLALATSVVCSVLFQIPNEPIVFTADPARQERSEGAIDAFCFYLAFSNTSRPEVLIQLPMTKGAVRAMDAITEFLALKLQLTITEFMVTGASKRGWTTWLTAAVDRRVVAMAPIVFDAARSVHKPPCIVLLPAPQAQLGARASVFQ